MMATANRMYADRYFQGDRIDFTGKSDVFYGEKFYEATFAEGCRRGKTCWTPKGPAYCVDLAKADLAKRHIAIGGAR